MCPGLRHDGGTRRRLSGVPSRVGTKLREGCESSRRLSLGDARVPDGILHAEHPRPDLFVCQIVDREAHPREAGTDAFQRVGTNARLCRSTG